MKEYLIIELEIGYDERVKVTYRESNQTNIFVWKLYRGCFTVSIKFSHPWPCLNVEINQRSLIPYPITVPNFNTLTYSFESSLLTLALTLSSWRDYIRVWIKINTMFSAFIELLRLSGGPNCASSSESICCARWRFREVAEFRRLSSVWLLYVTLICFSAAR